MAKQQSKKSLATTSIELPLPNFQPYTIEKDIPLTGRQKAQRFPFDFMEVGNSFFVPNGNIGTVNGARKLFQKRNPQYAQWVFANRTVKNGVRCWRIA